MKRTVDDQAARLAVRRRLGALIIGRTESRVLRLDQGHPLRNILYVGHPAKPDLYFPAAEFHRRVFEHKFVEAVTLLTSLGARDDRRARTPLPPPHHAARAARSGRGRSLVCRSVPSSKARPGQRSASPDRSRCTLTRQLLPGSRHRPSGRSRSRTPRRALSESSRCLRCRALPAKRSGFLVAMTAPSPASTGQTLRGPVSWPLSAPGSTLPTSAPMGASTPTIPCKARCISPTVQTATPRRSARPS